MFVPLSSTKTSRCGSISRISSHHNWRRSGSRSLASTRFFQRPAQALEGAAQWTPGTPLDLNSLPDGLEGYYAHFWSQLQRELAENFIEWTRLYRPVIECLAVAAEPVTVAWLADQLPLDPDEIQLRALPRWERLLSRVPQRNGIDVWHVVHRSFTDFLESRIDLQAVHRAVAERYTGRYAGQWTNWDIYGLRHVLSHVTASAQLSTSPEYHELAQQAEALALDEGFQREYLNRLGDPMALERTLVRVLETITSDEAASPLSVFNVAFEIVHFRREQRRPQPIFEHARRGDLVDAERRLNLFSLQPDRHWEQALLLMVAWLAADKDLTAARQLRDRVASDLGGFYALQTLLARVNATLDGAPLPAVSLPSPPEREVAELMVARLATGALSTSMLSEFQVELLNRQNQAEPIGDDGVFLAHENGPPLVALVVADPPLGEQLLSRYVAIHAAYGYPQYRQGSLWALLEAVLNHPSQDWVRRWVMALGGAALAPNRGEYYGALQQAVSAHRVLAGLSEAWEERKHIQRTC